MAPPCSDGASSTQARRSTLGLPLPQIVMRFVFTRLSFALGALASGSSMLVYGQAQPVQPLDLEAYLKASNTRTSAYFGQSVAISGDTIVVGSPGESSDADGVNGDSANASAPGTGAVYVFVRSGDSWAQQAYLKASNSDGDDQFGHSVAISGDTIVVGAKNEGSSAQGVNGYQFDNSSPYSGAAYVFVRSGATWTQEAYLKASNTDAGDLFGSAVAIHQDTVIVGAPSEQSSAIGVDGDEADDALTRAGAAYVFQRSSGVWSQQAYLKASNTNGEDQFATSVSLFGDLAVVGAFLEDSASQGIGGDPSDNSLADSGAAYIFERTSGVWSQQEYLKASNAGSGDTFGWSVSIWEDTVAIGARYESSAATEVDGDQADDSGSGRGAVYVFTLNGLSWTQVSYLKSSSLLRSEFGYAVAVSGSVICVGHGSGQEQAVIYTREASSWSERDVLDSPPTGYTLFGGSVGVSGGTTVIGAFTEGSSSTGVNGDMNDTSAPASGAAFAYSGQVFVPSSFCFGDGTGTPCPCGNNGYPGEGCANSTGGGAWLSTVGSSLVSADDLAFVAVARRPNQPGVVIQGAAQVSVPFRDGILCMGNPTERLEIMFLDAFGKGRTTGSIVSAGDVLPGDTRYYQLWYRDPGGISPCGSDSNLSNGLIVTWY